MTTYNQLLEDFSENPRDICTVPLTNKEPVWFYVFTKNGALFVDKAKFHNNSSSIVKSRELKETECSAMLDIYHRRQKGEAVSRVAAEITRNQVYWYGVFSELGL